MSDIPERQSVRRRSTWSVVDFILVWLGGFLGAGIGLVAGLLLENSDWVIVLGLAGQYVGNLGVLWLLSKSKVDSDLGFSVEPRDVRYIVLGLIIQLALALLFLPLAELLFPDGRPPQQVAEAIADAGGSTLLKVSLILAAVILAPVTEELIYRGVLLKALANRSKRLAIVTTAAVFAAVHVIGLDTERIWASAAVVLPPIFALGVILAWVTLRTGRLGPAIFLHSGWNLLAAFVLLIPNEVFDAAA